MKLIETQQQNRVHVDQRAQQRQDYSKTKNTECSRSTAHVNVSRPIPIAAKRAKPKILMIEDDNLLQTLIKAVLIKAGGDVLRVVESVDQAITAIADQLYDLVICDLGLIGGTGIDVMNWTKSNKSHPNQATPFVVLTANTDAATCQTALSSGFLEIFQKPMSEKVAREILMRYSAVEVGV